MNKMFITENCSRCGKKIPESELKLEPIYWICSCGHKNYKTVMKGDLRVGGESNEHIIRKVSLRPNLDKSIMKIKKNRWTHEVKDKDGNVTHQEHDKYSAQ